MPSGEAAGLDILGLDPDSLPGGWRATTMGEVAEVVGGATPRVSEPGNFADEGSAWITPADLGGFNGVRIRRGARCLTERGLRGCSARMMPAGTVLMSSRAPIGYVAVAEGPISTNQGFKSFVCQEGLAPEYVYYWLRFANPLLQAMGSGSTFTEISGRRAREIPIILPPTDAEQRRIVATIEELLTHVNVTNERLARVPAVLKRFRQSVLAAACSGRLTADWRETAGLEPPDAILAALRGEHEAAGTGLRRNAALPSEGVHDLDTSALPDQWRASELQWLCEPGRLITYGILKPGPDFPSGIPYVRVADYPRDAIRIEGIRRTSPEIAAEYQRAALRYGDVLLAIRGTYGRVCKVPRELDGANITQDTARVSVADTINSDYVAWYLRSEAVQKRMQRAAKGVAVRGVNIGDVRALQIAVPPRPEQDEIVRRVEALFALADSVGQRVAAATARADRVTQAILAKAFRGELVPTAGDDAGATGSNGE